MFYNCDMDDELDNLDPDTLENYINELEHPETGILSSSTSGLQESSHTANDQNTNRTSQGPINQAPEKPKPSDRTKQTCRKGTRKAVPETSTDYNRTSDSHDRQLLNARSSLPIRGAAHHNEPDSSDSDSDIQAPPQNPTQASWIENQELDGTVVIRNGKTYLPFRTKDSESISKRRCQVCHRTDHTFGGTYTNYILCKKCRLFLIRCFDNPRKGGYKCISNGNCRVVQLGRGERPCPRCRLTKALKTGLVLPKDHPYYTDVDDSPCDTNLSQGTRVGQVPNVSTAGESTLNHVDTATGHNNDLMDSTDSDTVVDESQPTSVASKSSSSTVLEEPTVSKSHEPPTVEPIDHERDLGSNECFINDMYLSEADMLMQQAILDSCRRMQQSDRAPSPYRPEIVELSSELDEFGLPKNIQDLYNRWFYEDLSQIAPNCLPTKNPKTEIVLEKRLRKDIIICNQFDTLDPKITFLTEDLSEADPSSEVTTLSIEIRTSDELTEQENRHKISCDRIDCQQAEVRNNREASIESPELSIEMKLNRTIIDRRPAELKKRNDNLRSSQNSTSNQSHPESVIAPGEDCDDSDDCDSIEVD